MDPLKDILKQLTIISKLEDKFDIKSRIKAPDLSN